MKKIGIPKGRCVAETALTVAGAVLCLIFAVLGPESPGAVGPLGHMADTCESALCRTIDGIPFPDPRSAPLVKALVAGDRSDVSPQMKAVFRDAGASHLLALSGLHLGILYAILSKILLIIGNSPAARWTRGSLILAASFFYVLMTGASPSIVRAFIFIVIATLARCLGRKTALSRTLFTALAIQLLIWPGNIFLPGFQLSYMAVLGIATVYRPLRDIYPGGADGKKRGMLGRIWDMMVLSISCQLFTTPLTWLLFRTFPLYFLLTNLLAIPCTSVLMTVSLTTVGLSAAGCCPGCLVSAADALCRFMLFILGTISSM